MGTFYVSVRIEVENAIEIEADNAEEAKAKAQEIIDSGSMFDRLLNSGAVPDGTIEDVRRAGQW